MKTTHHILFLAHVFLAAETFAQTVEIGERPIPLTFADAPSIAFDTNRVARELTAFFRIADTPETLFGFDMALPEESKPLQQVCAFVPPVTIANGIRYVPSPDERIVVGTNALTWLLTAIQQAEPYSNTWTQAEALVDDLTSGAITNDPARLRQAFVLTNGRLIDTPDYDEKLTETVSTYWTQLRPFPLSLVDWRTNRWANAGPVVPILILKHIDTGVGIGDVRDEELVFQEGRWRAVLW